MNYQNIELTNISVFAFCDTVTRWNMFTFYTCKIYYITHTFHFHDIIKGMYMVLFSNENKQ